MKEIEENEKEIISKIILNNEGKSVWDENGYRVHWLVKHSLNFIAYSKEGGGWESLFYEPKTKTYCEREYLNSNLQGGGPHRYSKFRKRMYINKYEF